MGGDQSMELEPKSFRIPHACGSATRHSHARRPASRLGDDVVAAMWRRCVMVRVFGEIAAMAKVAHHTRVDRDWQQIFNGADERRAFAGERKKETRRLAGFFSMSNEAKAYLILPSL
jgi:hypothetical protein